MILLLDSLNHSQEPSGHWRIGEQEGDDPAREPAKFIYLRTSPTAAPRAGEITVSYGDKGNEELLFQYGFALPHNPHETVMVLSPLSSEDPLFPDKFQLLQGLGYGPRMMFHRGRTELDEKTLDIARITVVDDSDQEMMAQKVAAFEDTGAWEKGMLTPANEARALAMLVSLLQNYLGELKKIVFTTYVVSLLILVPLS